MLKRQIFIFFYIFLIHFSNTTNAQQKVLSKTEINVLIKEATYLLKIGKYDQSLIKSRKILTHCKLIQDDNLTAICYNTIAANVDELNYPEKALFYYNKSLFYANKTNNDDLKNKLNNNLGNIYCFDKNQFERGFKHLKKSIEYSTKIQDSTQIYFTTINIIWACFDNKYYDKGLTYLNFANNFYKKYGDARTIVALNMLNGIYSNHINKNNLADSYFNNAINLGLKGDEKSDLAFAYQEYSKFLFKTGNYKKAYANLEWYSKINDELYNEELLIKTNIARLNLELDETKREVLRVEKNYKKKQNLLNEKQTKNNRMFLIIIAVLALFGVLLYFFFQNAKLKQKNKLNKIRSKLQLNIINATFDGQDTERKKLAGFLHDNISSKLSSAGLQLFAFSAIHKTDSEEIKKAKEILKEVHDEIRNLSHNLLPTLLTKFGLFFALQDLCEKNSNALIHFEYFTTVAGDKRYSEDFETKIYFIISELFNNILKHSEASKAVLSIDEENNELLFTIEDNGKGFKNSKSATEEGFGLTQIRARVYNMDGKLTINTTINIGTLVQIKIPIQEKS